MTAEEIIKARKLLGLPIKMRVRHERYGMTDVWAYHQTQAEMQACIVWKAKWDEVYDGLRVTVLRDQSGYEPLMAEV